MIEIKDKEGKVFLKTDKNLKDLIFVFEGKLQEITEFKLTEKGNFDHKIKQSLFEILYEWYWNQEGSFGGV